ncbi:MAG: hypothetical protein NWF00_05060 [Candidatus Bathyarchaeota archaeon]|nr:hypothetical protein [Candidatus Bathyarchaeota archaeon]
MERVRAGLRIDDKEAFDALMDACRSHASAGSNATRPIVFEPMMMSIVLWQQKELAKLRKQLGSTPRRNGDKAGCGRKRA